MKKKLSIFFKKRSMYGKNVSKSNRKTHRKFNINRKKYKVSSFLIGRKKINIRVKLYKTVEKKGGMDIFLKKC